MMSVTADYDGAWKEALDLYLRPLLEFCFTLGCGLHPIRTKPNSSLRSHTRFIRGGVDVLN